MKVLLYSGGTDSWLIDKLWKPDQRIYVDMGTRYSKEEISRLPAVVDNIVDFRLLGRFEDPVTAYIPLRNLFLLAIAAQYGDQLCYGAVSGDEGSRDKCMEFIDMTESLFRFCLEKNTTGADRKIRIERRFMKMTKYDLLKEWLSEGGTTEEFVSGTFSCHHPVNGHECLACKPCYRKFLLAKYFGHDFGEEAELKMLDYMKKNVVPRRALSSGTYFADRPGEGPYAVEAMDRFFRQYGLDWRNWQ